MLNVYYYRFDQDYSGWDLWIWQKGSEGASFPFDGEMAAHGESGKIIRFAQVPTDRYTQPELGLIIRRNGWAERDTDADRYVNLDVTTGSGIWLMQGDGEIYTSESDLSLLPTAERAVFQSARSIFVRMQAPTEANATDPFMVYENGMPFAVSGVQHLGGGKDFLIMLADAFAPDASCMVEKRGFEMFPVMHGALYDLLEFEQMLTYEGDDLGANWQPDATRFLLWAPTAERVQINLFEDCAEDTPYEIHDLDAHDRGVWAISVPGNLDGVYYTYSVTVDGFIREVVDPYARTAGPNGQRAMVFDPSTTDPEGWDAVGWVPCRTPTDAILYEIHVRDMTIHPESGIRAKGKYLGLAETETRTPDGILTGLSHLAELGVTHVHFLPIFDFFTIDETRLHQDHFNWGYDPHLYNVPEGSYATDPRDGRVRIRELKQMILALKRAGIGVVMDVVYNHTYRTHDSVFNRIVPGYYYRTDRQGRYSNGSGCGNETASERAMMRRYMIDSVVRWAKEYRIDGFRFDLMALHDIETMNGIRRALDAVSSSILMYGEGWTGGSSLLDGNRAALKVNAPKLQRIGVFNDNLRDAVKGDTFSSSDGGWLAGVGRHRESVKFGVVGAVYHHQVDYGRVNYNGFAWAGYTWHCVNYAAAHDNLTLFDKLQASVRDLSETDAMKLTNLAGAIVLTSQGIPFMLAGTEFMRTKKGVHDSYNAPDEINRMDWPRKREYLQVFRYHQGLIRLRREHPAFRMTSGEEVRRNLSFVPTPEHMIVYLIRNAANGDAWSTILVAFNTGTWPDNVQPPFTADWHVVVDDRTAGVDTLSVVPGQQLYIPARSALIAWTNTERRPNL